MYGLVELLRCPKENILEIHGGGAGIGIGGYITYRKLIIAKIGIFFRRSSVP